MINNKIERLFLATIKNHKTTLSLYNTTGCDGQIMKNFGISTLISESFSKGFSKSHSNL